MYGRQGKELDNHTFDHFETMEIKGTWDEMWG